MNMLGDVGIPSNKEFGGLLGLSKGIDEEKLNWYRAAELKAWPRVHACVAWPLLQGPGPQRRHPQPPPLAMPMA